MINKKYPLIILAFIFIIFFTSLGFWQLSRAEQKERLLNSYADRIKQTKLTVSALNPNQDLRFYQVILKGRFDNQRTLLLDNKIFHGQIGYEVYTPFKVIGLTSLILVDRGFIPLGKNRAELPIIPSISGIVTITGMLNQAPKYIEWSQMSDAKSASLERVQYINLKKLAALFNHPLFPYVVTLTPHHEAAFAIEWQILTMGPERHRGYALQWFALALTLLVICAALNKPRK